MRKNIFLAIAASLSLSACLFEEKNKEEVIPEVKIGITNNKLSNDYLSKVVVDSFNQAAERLGNVKLTINDANNSFETQKNQVKALMDSGVDSLIISLADSKPEHIQEIIRSVCSRNIPAVYFNTRPTDRALATCDSAYYAGVDDARIGVMQALNVLDLYSKNPEADKDEDGVIQYGLINIDPYSPISKIRTSWLENTLQYYPDIGMSTEKIYEDPAYANRNEAKAIVEEWIEDADFERLEIIVTNTDSTALGVLDALKKHNLNIPVFSSGGTPEAINANINTVDIRLADAADLAVVLARNLGAKISTNKDIPYQIEDKVALSHPHEVGGHSNHRHSK